MIRFNGNGLQWLDLGTRKVCCKSYESLSNTKSIPKWRVPPNKSLCAKYIFEIQRQDKIAKSQQDWDMR